jgi:hypothetical protein
MKRLIVLLLFLASVLLATSELPIQNIGMLNTCIELQAGDTIYVLIGTTTTAVKTYVIPRDTKEFGYDFSVPVTTSTIYLIWHGTVR